jgi:hypothetical protein
MQWNAEHFHHSIQQPMQHFKSGTPRCLDSNQPTLVTCSNSLLWVYEHNIADLKEADRKGCVLVGG